MALLAVTREPDLVIANACRKTAITLGPYCPRAPSLDYF